LSLTPLQRRNYAFHCLEGGIYMGGLAFVAAETVLPKMVHNLGGPQWVVALSPSLLQLCNFLPGPFVTPFIERMRRLFPYVVTCGVAQRLIYLTAAIILACAGPSHPEIVLWVVALTPVIAGLLGGAGIPAWLEMVTRMVPEGKRASAWAIRFLIGTGMGVGEGLLMERILAAHPGAGGYAILHAVTAFFLFISLALFVFLRETDSPDPAPAQPGWYSRQFRIFREIIRTPSPFRDMLVVRLLGYGFMILAPYLSITVLKETGRPESDLGRFVMAQMLGAIAGNFLAGWLGDRQGGKRVLMVAKAVQLGVCGLLFIEGFYLGYLLAFFLFGMGWVMWQVGDNTLGIELSPTRRRTAHLALFNFTIVPGSLLSALAAWQLHLAFDSLAPLAWAAAFCIAGSIWVLRTIHEPRSRRLTTIGAS